MKWHLRRARTKGCKVQEKHDGQRGAAALEFALVFPLFVVVMCGVFTFSFAYLGRQLLSNMAAETARACVLRSAGGQGAVTNCVQTLGAYLASTTPYVCFGGKSKVYFLVNPIPLSQAGLSPTARRPAQEFLLVVTATCNFTFAPGTVNILQGDTPVTPSILQANAAMPFTLASGQ